MRTGAIFARGSCRALKWMALFGVFFALGTGQAFAQATFDSGAWSPGGNEIELTMSEAVYGSPAESQFVVTVTPSGGTASPNAVTNVRIGKSGSPSLTIGLTVTNPIMTLSTVVVGYTAPATATDDANIFDSDGGGVTGDNSSISATERNSVPTLAEVSPLPLRVDVEMMPPLVLPAATGGNGVITYALDDVDNTTNATGGDMPPGLTFTATTRVLSGTPTTNGTYNMSYTATDAATPGSADVATQRFTITVSAAPPPPVVGGRGQITEFKLIGDVVVDKTIAGAKRHHVPEGSQGVDLEVTVQWDNSEVAAIGYDRPQTIDVMIMDDRGTRALPAWLSWVDPDGQDVHFPRTAGRTGTVTVRTPRESQVPASQRGSDRHHSSATGTLDLLILHDDHEAENDAFYIEAVGGDVNLNVTASVDRTTLDVVIEDDEDQKVVIRNSSRSTGPTSVYEPAGSSTIDSSPTFTVAASPARNELPLEVRLDMVDLNDQTVSAAQISLSTASLTLNDGTTGNSGTVDVNLPDSDGNRMDDDYKLNASVNVYTVASGGYRTIPVAEHAITVIDRHKLPTLAVSPATATVAEGGMVELTLTINRNPSNTTVSSTEQLQYTQEEVTVMLAMGGGSTATAADYSMMPASVTFPARTRGSYTASMMLEVEAITDDELDDMEMLVLDASVTGGVAANGTAADMHMGVSTLTIEDATVKQIEPKTEAEVKKAVDDAMAAGGGDEGLNPGESFSVMVSDLFTETTGYTGDYDVSATGSAVKTSISSNGDVMVEAVEVGMSTVTVTAKASMSMSSAVATRQTSADSAEVDFDVDVVNKKLMVTVAADPMTVEEGGTSMITASVEGRAVHANDGTVKIDLTVDGDATLSADSITIMAGDMTGSVTLTATDDEDYDDETVTVTYSGPGIDGQKQLMISVTDPDEATPTVRAKTDAAEKIAAAIEKAAGGAEWMVGGMVAEVEMDGLFDLDEGVTATYQGTTSDADVVKAMTTGNTLMLTPMGAGMATITVTGADNAGGSEAAMVTYDATVILANLTMTVTVEPMTVEEGGMATITAKASRMIAMSDGMVKVNLSVVGDATLSAEMIEIEADSDTGTATLTSTDDEMHEPDGETVTLIASGAGIDGNMSFDIMVTDNDAAPMDITFTLSADKTDIPEGESGTLTATASAAVEADTEIMIMRDGTSTAGADDYTAESITIMAGETTGTTTVMAVDDGPGDSGSGMPEMLTLYGMVGTMQTNSVTFNIWDAAVPALPVIAQLLLAVFLAIGGYRRYLRR